MNPLFHRKYEALNRQDREEGTFKELKYLEGPMDGSVEMEGLGETVILSSNNYLGLSNHPRVKKAGIRAVEEFGAGTASVRFICGTFSVHRELEEEIARFLSTESALSYVACWNANTGVIPLLAAAGDAIVSDELNHASIIDGVRLSKAARFRYAHSDMGDLEEKLIEARRSVGAEGTILIITDGVFSMEGDIAKLPQIVRLAERHQAATFVDDSHGTGVMGGSGRGTIEHYGLEGEIDVITSTLGKALGGAAGGFVASSRAVIERSIQASRPHLFSNALPATIAASSLEAIRTVEREPAILEKLRENTRRIRQGLAGLGFKPLEGESAIIPIILGKTAFAIEMSRRLLDEGVFVTGFGYPVVPEGSARVRIQSSAALTKEQIEKAISAFEKVGKELDLI